MKVFISVFFLFVSVVNANAKVNDVVKVFDGSAVECGVNEHINNQRTGAYKLKINKLQTIT